MTARFRGRPDHAHSISRRFPSLAPDNGEALLKLLTAKGLSFKYERSWVPSIESWIADFYNPPKPDQDEWN